MRKRLCNEAPGSDACASGRTEVRSASGQQAIDSKEFWETIKSTRMSMCTAAAIDMVRFCWILESHRTPLLFIARL